LSSAKHQKLTTYNIKSSDNNKQTATLSKYCCPVCDKKYNDRAGLWRHKKKCININNKLDEQSLVLEILKQNQEYQKLLLLQQQQILELTAKMSGNI
jgi:ribosomal protein L37AE/L43A